MSLQDAHKLALKVLKEVMEEKVDGNNVQLAQVSFSLISPLLYRFANCFTTTGHQVRDG